MPNDLIETTGIGLGCVEKMTVMSGLIHNDTIFGEGGELSKGV